MSGYKNRYDESQKLLRQSEQELVNQVAQVASLQEQLSGKVVAYEADIAEKDTEISTLIEEKESLEVELKTLQESLKITDGKLRDRELSRFAEQYREQEDRYATQQREWMGYSLGAGGLLLAGTLFTALGGFGVGSFQPELVFLNVVLLTIFVYCLRQHSHLANLRDDYANRKALAQSYQYIAQGDETDGLNDIRMDFFEKATDTFTRKPASRGNDVSLQDAFLTKLLGQSGK